MSVNTAHTNGGVLIHYGEYILIHSENVSLDFVGQDNPIFKGTKNGHIYLTSHRMIFNSKKQNEELMSFSAPFIAMSDVDIEQPVFGANYIKGKVRAQPNGNFIGEVKFKLYFKSGGAIEYGQAMLRAASIAQQNMRNSNGNFDDPPPYTPSGAWHEAPPPAYQPPPGYYGWIPQNDAFTGPAPNSVFVSDNPPPYPGIGTPPTYQNHQNYPSEPQQGGYGGGGYPPQTGGYGGAAGYPMPGYAAPQGAGGYPGQGGYPQGGGYAPPQGAYGPPPSYGGFTVPPQQGGFPTQPGYPPYGQQPGASAPPVGGYTPAMPNGYPGYPGQGGSNGPSGSMGFSAPPANSKEAEALRSAFNTTENQRNNQQHQQQQQQQHPNDMPPPSYGDLPPTYNSLNDRRNY
ncbi:postacrosomal sheath WW domain-binding protein isoform X1 [Episyrphus balteatus]|uniref:postacrosomal sheath WW domain-binding protein isoform X1 n=1 Tax=Episyrphus balteatus TaxID=286459 RepID=UPI00248522AE|nr:postacrosomal sheath WW domain-binding protein isoform X1 [Episyrphus balteatus]